MLILMSMANEKVCLGAEKEVYGGQGRVAGKTRKARLSEMAMGLRGGGIPGEVKKIDDVLSMGAQEGRSGRCNASSPASLCF